MPAATDKITDTITDAWTDISATIPTNPRDAVYTALGIPVLVLDEVRTRLAPARKVADKQVDLARKHASEATREWQDLISGFGRQEEPPAKKKATPKAKKAKKTVSAKK